jgi:L-asparaginase
MTLPEVSVLSLGGTISSTNAGGPGVTPTLTGEALVEAVPQIPNYADVSAASLRRVPGSDVTVEDAVEVAREARRLIGAGAAGVVVTQGTDSIEETSFVLDLLVGGEAPIVVTGAMRNPTLPGADGPANLLAAVQVAASPEARGLGALVVFNDEIHAASLVRKTHTQSPATFSSWPLGPIGYVAENRVRVVLRPASRRGVDLDFVVGEGRVAVLTASMGDDGGLIPAVREAGYAGLVVEALGGGHVPSPWVEPLAALAGEMPVVLASRTGGGEVLRETYSFSGSEMDLAGRGLIPSGSLDGRKARLLLTLLLRSGAGEGEISSAFRSG